MKDAGPDTVEVILLTGLKKSLGYRVPEPMRGDIAIGSLVPLLITDTRGEDRQGVSSHQWRLSEEPAVAS